MVSFFGGLFAKKGESVIGIDIGSSSVKVVQLKKRGGRAVLETYGALALGPYANLEIGRATRLPIEKVMEALRDILREAKTTTVNAGVAIPFASSLMTLIEMPLVGPRELAQMIPIEARKYIPVPITEVTLDWSIIPRNEEVPLGEERTSPNPQKTDVLLVAIHNDILLNYQDIVTKVKIDASFFEIEIFSTMRSVLDQEVLPVLIFDMGAASTKLYIIERGAVRVSHTINRGSQDLTLALARSLAMSVAAAEELKRSINLEDPKADTQAKSVIVSSLEYVFSEANRVILNYQRKYNKALSKIVLVGGGSALKGLRKIAQDNFKADTVAGDPFSKVETPAFLSQMLKTTGPEFTVALGLALRKLQESD
jgi:type IV pilus assembly protein PilM